MGPTLDELPIESVANGDEPWTLRGGRVVCPVNGIDELLDLQVKSGRIAAIKAPGEIPASAGDVDVKGSIITPGLIDFHVHTAQPQSSYGVCADRNGIAAGVCHVNDMAGVGWLGANVLRDYAARIRTPLTGTMYVAGVGNPENWGFGCPQACDATTNEELLEGAIRSNRDLFKSIKVHVDRGFLSIYGDDPLRGYWVARRVSKRLGIPLYLHLGLLGPDDGHLDNTFNDLLNEVIDSLEPGDVIGHVLSPWPDTLMDGAALWDKLLERKDVFWEVGHGVNMSFDRARLWAGGNRPLLISSDAHLSSGHMGRVDASKHLPHQFGVLNDYTLIGTMNKLRAVGYSLADVVRGATSIPARALGLQDSMGELTVGRPANISVLEERIGSFVYTDSRGSRQPSNLILMPNMVALGGQLYRISSERLEEFSTELGAHMPDKGRRGRTFSMSPTPPPPVDP